MKLRVGLVGLGDAWEKQHLPALRALGDRFDVRAVCEQVARRAEQAAGEFDAVVVDGFRALLEREDIDAILILSTQWFGPVPILAACDAGKAVYLGSSLDLDPARARQIKERVQQAGVAFMAAFPRRLSPATLRLKELIATTLGPPRLLFCHHRLSVADPKNHATGSQPKHLVAREMVELVDWCRYVAGTPPRWVTGMTHHRADHESTEDYQMLSLDFRDADGPGAGPVAQISCGHYIPTRWHEALTYRPLAALQVSCRDGIAFVDLPTTLIWFDDAGRHQESLESERPVGEQLLIQFYRAVTSLVSKPYNLEDAYSAMSIVQEAARSHREGRRIALE